MNSMTSKRQVMSRRLVAGSTRDINSFFVDETLQEDPICTINEEEEEDDDNEETERKSCTKFCSLMDSYPVAFVLGGALLGAGIGFALSRWEPENQQRKENVILWVGLIGDLFIRALKLIVLPLVFVSIAISVMDMLSLGKAGTVVGTTIGLYVCTTIAAAIIGSVVSIIFSRFYDLADDGDATVGVAPEFRIGCDDPGFFLTEFDDGSVGCTNVTLISDTKQYIFDLDDINGYYQKSPAAQGMTEITLSESIYQGVFMMLIADNMNGIFYENNFLGTIVLGAAFGVALTRLSAAQVAMNGPQFSLIQIFEELLKVFMLFVDWIIKCTPIAVLSLIAAAIGSLDDVGQAMAQVGYLLVATIVGLFMQLIFVYCGLYALFTRSNPISYLKNMVPAYTLSFASASSAATIPVSIECAKNTGKVPDGVARFCIPLGATINMDGAAIYIICASIWMAYLNGIVPTVGDYILLIMCATLGSMGAAPVPSAGIVLILTSYETVFGSDGTTPEGFAYLFAIDWFVDRMITMFNVGGDLIVTGIVADRVDKKVATDDKGDDIDELKETGEPLSSIEEIEETVEEHK